jgi:hypothetical protein
MSRKRKQIQAQRRLLEPFKDFTPEEMAAKQEWSDAMAQKEYKFTFNTPRGPSSFKVPRDRMKICPCGSEFFRIRFLVGYVKPSGVIGAEPARVLVEHMICEKCEREVQSNDKTIFEANGGVEEVLPTDVEQKASLILSP